MYNPQPNRTPHEECLFLAGHPPVEGFLGFIKSQVEGGGQLNRSELMEEWRQANDHLSALEQEEAGIADNPQIDDLPSEVEDLEQEIRNHPIFERAFGHSPVEIGLVNLDEMVVFQKKINLAYAERLTQKIGEDLSLREMVELAFPLDSPMVPFQAIQAQNTFSFVSESDDLRFLDAVTLTPDQIEGYTPSGKVAGVVGLVVGYGSNCLSAIRWKGRLVLNNGSHRAFALRKLGVRRVPCLIKEVPRQEELSFLAPDEVASREDLYFENPRPPMLKDYFDSDLRTKVSVPKKAKQVRVAFQQEALPVPWGQARGHGDQETQETETSAE